MITKVTMSRNFEKQLDRVPDFIQSKVVSWIFSLNLVGLAETRKKPGLHDEPLKGSRKGQRSVRLNKAYRLIYWVLQDQVHIELLEVHKHEY